VLLVYVLYSTSIRHEAASGMSVAASDGSNGI
jgi:hypothetical protein